MEELRVPGAVGEWCITLLLLLLLLLSLLLLLLLLLLWRVGDNMLIDYLNCGLSIPLC